MTEHPDQLLQAVSRSGGLRILIARTTRLVQEAQRIHEASPLASAALGRTLTMTAFLGRGLKSPTATLSVNVRGSGPLGPIVTVVDGAGHLKGSIAHPEVWLPPNAKGKLDVSGGVGLPGRITVVKDLGLKEPYVGQVALVSGELGEDFVEYLRQSEQTPSGVALGVRVGKDAIVEAAGGFMIQAMPEASDEELDAVEAALDRVESISALIHAGETPQSLLDGLFGALDFQVLSESEPVYRCDCSRERLERALISLGRKQLSELHDEGHAELQCHFCNTKYQFDRADLAKLLLEAGGEGESEA